MRISRVQCPSWHRLAQVLESVEQGYRQLHRDLSDRAAQYVETIGNEVLAYSSTRR